MTTTNTPRRLSAAESSRLLKKALRRDFPLTRFSVRMSRGTGYGNCHVAWTEGPTGDEVRSVTEHFCGRGFDGMTDSTTYRNAVVDVNGEACLSGLGMILLHRSGCCA